LVDVTVDPVAPIGYPALVQTWLRRSTPFGLEASARALLAERAGVGEREVDAILAGHTRGGRDHWTSEQAHDPPGQVAVWLCDCALGRSRFEVLAAPVRPGQLLAVGVELVGPCCPAILLDAGRFDDPRACRAAAALVGEIQRDASDLPLVVASSRRAISAYLESTVESPTKALVRRSVAAWSATDEPSTQHHPRHETRHLGGEHQMPPVRPWSTTPHPDVSTRPGAGPPSPTPPACPPAAPSPPAPIGSPPAADPDDEARRRAERVLFRSLEADHRTAGRFQPSARLEVDFGGRPAEVDLVCRQPRLAVEIDGYRHLSDAEAYRRDRHKDLVLQVDGWVVVRVLAADAASDPAGVVDTIATTLADLPKGESAHYDQS
jgi:very-short-patch-repair endonuclease